MTGSREVQQLDPVRWDPSETAAWLFVPGPESDKYRRGVLGARIGSVAYPGAAVLGVTAAWRAGVGMLRYVSPGDQPGPSAGLPSPAAAVLAARPETVIAGAAADSCEAWLIGSGTDPAHRSDSEAAELRELLEGDAPVVVDAGALTLAADVARSGDLAPAILTPHRGEFERLWEHCGMGPLPHGWPDRAHAAPTSHSEVLTVLAVAAARLAERLGATVLLKGSVTVVAAPGAVPSLVGPATPWLATAGTGDVLAGALGALTATHADAVRREPAILGSIGAAAAQLHDTAARLASGANDAARGTGRPITALDVANALPAAFERLRTGGS